ncbi:MAG: hypothetical protein HOP31_00865, partial [Ignavibacteria bacterium]|nr:hypothetical protein [Ignavibacteria bacterium]
MKKLISLFVVILLGTLGLFLNGCDANIDPVNNDPPENEDTGKAFVLTSVDEGANWVKRSVSGVTSLTKVISFEGIADKFCIVGYKVSDKSTNIYKTIDGANNFTNVYHSYNYIRDIS